VRLIDRGYLHKFIYRLLKKPCVIAPAVKLIPVYLNNDEA
jgi:hypothetical protein